MLVTDKREKFAELYSNKSSLMVVINLVTTCLVITAVKVAKPEFVQTFFSVEAVYLLQGL
jgi:hypothetical protein